MSFKDVGIESKKACEARTGSTWTEEEYNEYYYAMHNSMKPGSD